MLLRNPTVSELRTEYERIDPQGDFQTYVDNYLINKVLPVLNPHNKPEDDELTPQEVGLQYFHRELHELLQRPVLNRNGIDKAASKYQDVAFNGKPKQAQLKPVTDKLITQIDKEWC